MITGKPQFCFIFQNSSKTVKIFLVNKAPFMVAFFPPWVGEENVVRVDRFGSDKFLEIRPCVSLHHAEVIE